MEITIRHNSVYLRNVDLGESFSNIMADLIVDKLGRVKVETESKHSFYTDLDNLPLELLQAISKVLKKEAKNRILTKIEERVRRSMERPSGNQFQEV
jgi:hypothetical protein